MTPNSYRVALAGLGNVGSAVLRILQRESLNIRKRYGVEFLVTGVAELGGGAVDLTGLDLGLLLDNLQANRSVVSLPGIGRPGLTGLDLIEQARPQILLEATPVNLLDGQPGLDIVTSALQHNVHVVLANKGPLALAFAELAALSDLECGWGAAYDADLQHLNRPKLRFSATVAGALPTINLGWRDLAGSNILKIEAVFNGTTQYILRAMEAGHSYAAALEDAQRRGIAETDPTLDVDGWDAAAKLVIAANAVLGQTSRLADVEVEGIRSLSPDSLRKAALNSQRIVLVCRAELLGDRYHLSVRPTPLPLDHPLARLTADEMGVVYYTLDVERLFAASSEPSATPAAAAMLRDMLEIVRSL